MCVCLCACVGLCMSCDQTAPAVPVVAAAPPVVVDLSPLPPPSVTAMVAMVRQWLDLAVPPTTGVRSGDATVRVCWACVCTLRLSVFFFIKENNM